MKTILTSLIILLVLVLPAGAQTDIAGIDPQIINENAKANDIFEYQITLRNSSERKLDFYTLVYDYSVDQEGQKVLSNANDANRENSLSRWIRIKRGATETMPGEEKKIDLRIEVSPYAKPGKYSALIKFSPASNVDEARGIADSRVVPEVLLNFNVQEVVVEKAKIAFFSSKQNVYLKEPAIFNIKVNNSGNHKIIPQGEIFIFNRRGEEIGSVLVNQDKEPVQNESEKDYQAVWKQIKGFGKFKAQAELAYGQNNDKIMQDTVYFWFLPWPILSLFGGILILIVVLLTYALFRKSFHNYHMHLPHMPHPFDHHDQGGGVLDLKKKK